ncbi:TIGR00295 family protein [Archaeoglobus neptunius]|uniref:TIGR00295 family protein n=1 Tax=Archaeoglobus neptunius TaxID=2798580 RepID=UPI001927B313|nr:TIGR00295 family protein [Archaeoglobus neptunius]
MEIPPDVVEIWDRYGLEESVRRHCITVAKISMKIAERIKQNGHHVDTKLLLKGALLHDIGRAVTHDPFMHFIKSAEILRTENMDERVVRIAERHFSAGLSAEEAEKLGLEPKNYIPQTLEEKIVSFSDNLAVGDREGSFEDFMRRLEEIDRRSPELRWLTERTRERAKKIKEELERLSGLTF